MRETPRFQVEMHTGNATFGFRVLDNLTGKTHGFGLTLPHAADLAMEMNSEAELLR